MKKRETFLAFGTPDFTEQEIAAVARVMRSGWVGTGPETMSFEHELADYLDVPHVLTVNSCTSALFLALRVEGVGPGDEVIVPSLTWYASANAALYLGATPVFCDVDAESMCVTPEAIGAKLSPRTRAVVVVHYGGYAVDVDALRASLPPSVVIVEDAAHAMGARYANGKRVGSSGNSVCFSFYANKNLSTADGGAIALFDTAKVERLRSLSMSGMNSNAWARYTSPTAAAASGVSELGYKMNFTDLQSAIGRVQLRRLDEMAVHRQALVARYRDRMAAVGLAIPFQMGVLDAAHARHLLVGRFTQENCGLSRDELFMAMRARNVGVSIHYRPLHAEPLYRQLAAAGLPVTERLAEQIMTLPISARMSADDVDYVVDSLAALAPDAETSR